MQPAWKTCPDCLGTGKIWKTDYSKITCERCNGTGKIDAREHDTEQIKIAKKDPTTEFIEMQGKTLDKLNEIHQDIGEVKGRLYEGNERFTRVENDIGTIKENVTTLKNRDNAQNGRLNNIESDVKLVRQVKTLWKNRKWIIIALGILVSCVASVIAFLYDLHG